MSPSPLVTVLIATRNQASTLGRTLESVLAQDLGLERFEILVVVDGSTDGTLELLRSYGGRVRVRVQPHRGLAAACNAGLEEAWGEYLARLDSDDTAAPTWLRKLWEALDRRPDACGIYPDYQEISPEGRVWVRPARDGDLYSLMACGTLFRASALRQVGGYRDLYWEEYDLYLRLRGSGPLLHLPEPLYCVHRHPASMTADSAKRREGWRQLLGLWGPEILLAAGQDPDLTEVAAETTVL